MFTNTNNHLAFLVIAILAVYAISLNAPFYLDDFRNIQENRLLQTGTVQDFFLQSRFIGTLTFFAQEKLGLNSVLEYRTVNILLHTINSILVYILVSKLMILSQQEKQFVAFIAALIFALHPLNSQPVIYIVQRYTLLAALFYFLSSITYISIRQTPIETQKSKLALLLFCFVALLFLGWFSKQNFISIIFVCVLLEFLFFKKENSYKPLYIILGVISLSVAIFILASSSGKEMLAILDNASRETIHASRLEYFLAQLNIIWMYVGKFFIPVNLRLEYSIFSNIFSNLQSAVSLTAHIITILFAIFTAKKRPEITFAIGFFYCGHLIESTIIPIRDFAFEHRTYISNLSLAFLVSLVLGTINKRINKAKISILLTCVFVFALALSTHQRATTWNDKEQFFENEAKLSPKNPRVLTTLSKVYRNKGEIDKANANLEQAFIHSKNELREDVASNYLAMLVEQKRIAEANKLAKQLLPKIKDLQSKNQILHNLGALNFQIGQLDIAKNYFSQVCKSPHPLAESFYSLAIIALKQKDLKTAERTLMKLLSSSPSYRPGQALYAKVIEAKKLKNRKE